MAASTTSGFSLHVPVASTGAPATAVHAQRQRRIDPQAGHALEILGHAIDYLSDELVHNSEEVSPHNPNVQAVQLLMALNRQIYFNCPVVPSLLDRFRSFFLRRIH